MSVYSYSVLLVRDLECASRNFIWSDDTAKRKFVTVAWKHLCKPFSEEGLGIRSFITLNEASNLRICWDIFNSEESWATSSSSLDFYKQLDPQISFIFFSMD